MGNIFSAFISRWGDMFLVCPSEINPSALCAPKAALNGEVYSGTTPRILILVVACSFRGLTGQ